MMSRREVHDDETPGPEADDGLIAVNDARDEPPATEDSGRPESGMAIPLVLGVFTLALNALVFSRQSGVFTWRNVQSTVALTLLIVSVFIGLFLVLYAFMARRSDASSTGNRWLVRWVVIPLSLAILAPLLTARAMESYSDILFRQTGQPCVELYRQALEVRAVSPGFRMPARDPDQRRCFINEAVLR